MAKFLAWRLRRIMVFSGRSRFGGDGDEVHFTCGSVRGPWGKVWEAAGEMSLGQVQGQGQTSQRLGRSCGFRTEG